MVGACDTVGVIFNRLQNDPRTQEELQAAVGLPVLGMVPYDPELQQQDAQGKSLLNLADTAAAVKAVDAIVSKIMK